MRGLAAWRAVALGIWVVAHDIGDRCIAGQNGFTEALVCFKQTDEAETVSINRKKPWPMFLASLMFPEEVYEIPRKNFNLFRLDLIFQLLRFGKCIVSCRQGHLFGQYEHANIGKKGSKLN